MSIAAGAESGAKQSSVDLSNVIITLRKYGLRIALATALATLIILLVVSLLTPIYRATATLLISPPSEKRLVSIEELVAQDFVSNEYFQTQVEVLRSRKLARRVMSSLELKRYWEYNKSVERPIDSYNRNFATQIKIRLLEKFPVVLPGLNSDTGPVLTTDELEDLIVTQLLQNVTIRPLKETNLVKVIVRGVDPSLAKKIADGFGESFIDSYLDTKLELTNRASNWLNGKLVGMKEKLEESEAQLLAYKERYGLVNLGGNVSGINERRIGVLTERLVEAKRERREVRLLLREIDEANSRATYSVSGEVSIQQIGLEPVSSKFSEFESLSEISGNSLVSRHRIELLAAQGELDELSNRYGEKHPRVVDARSKLRGAARNLDLQINNVIDSVRKRYQLADADVRSIDSEIQREKDEVHTVSRNQVKMIELEREVEANRELYLKFYNRAREAVEAEGMSAANASFTDPASVSATPVFPRKRLLVFLGLVLSALVFSLIALLVERRRDTVQGVSDIIKRIGLPVLGIVPVLPTNRTKGGPRRPVLPGSFKDRLGAFEESFQTVRSSLYLGHDDASVIVVTSSLPGEGKSTIAANLAYAMAIMENVVLVEADMRRPSIGRAMGAGDLGLANYLSRECNASEIIDKSIGGLDLIPAGLEPYDPLELLSSDRFAELIFNLRKKYDRVIIDSAPVGAVSDAMVIGKLADVAVFVVKADSTQMEDIEISLDRLTGVDIKVAGAVISQVDMSKVVSYGGHYRYRGYYDQYGYHGRQNRTKPGFRGPARRALGT